MPYVIFFFDADAHFSLLITLMPLRRRADAARYACHYARCFSLRAAIFRRCCRLRLATFHTPPPALMMLAFHITIITSMPLSPLLLFSRHLLFDYFTLRPPCILMSFSDDVELFAAIARQIQDTEMFRLFSDFFLLLSG